MKELEELERKLAQAGKLDRLQAIADSQDGRTLAGALDTDQLQQAARSGDTDALRAILGQVLQTDAGKRLARQVKDAMQDG